MVVLPTPLRFGGAPRLARADASARDPRPLSRTPFVDTLGTPPSPGTAVMADNITHRHAASSEKGVLRAPRHPHSPDLPLTAGHCTHSVNPYRTPPPRPRRSQLAKPAQVPENQSATPR